MKDVLLVKKGLLRLLLDKKGVNPVNLTIVDLLGAWHAGISH